MKRFTNLFSNITLLIFIIAIATMAAKPPPKPDMNLTLDDNREVILHPDSTWEFAQFSLIQDAMDDIYMDLNDGRIICLKNDNTWKFVSRRPPKTKVNFDELPPGVNATTTATNKVLDVAVQSARKQVFERTATNLFKYAKKSKHTQQYLIACIKDEVGEAGAEVSYKPGWTATAKLSLDRVQINKIIDCVAVQVDAATPVPAADSTKKAPATTK